jgi:uncharacterized membrane protein YhaH (DUF805 family)
VTDPRTRRPEFWRNLGWVFAAAATVGIIVVIGGSRAGRLNMGLGVFFAVQSVLYFVHYGRAKRERDGGEV